MVGQQLSLFYCNASVLEYKYISKFKSVYSYNIFFLNESGIRLRCLKETKRLNNYVITIFQP